MLDNQSSQSTVEAGQVEVVLAHIASLPTLSQVAVRLLELTSDERTAVRDLVEVIELDQSLAARILSMAQRASIGSEAKTVEQAVILLGFNAVRQLALSLEIREIFRCGAESACTRFDQLGFWKHCLAVGCAAKLLAESKWYGREQPSAVPAVPSEEAFLCGLLHDLGKTALAACFPKSYDRAMERAEVSLTSILDAEREVFGLDHTLAGRRLATHWKLPGMIDECIWFHHHAPDSTPSRINWPRHVRLVQLADDLVHQLRIGHAGHYYSERSYWNERGMSPDDQAEIKRLKTELVELVEVRSELIGVDSLDSADVYQEALSQAHQELVQANERLTEMNRQLVRRSQCLEALQVFQAAMGHHVDHECICRAATRALSVVLPGVTVGMVHHSSARSLVYLASHRGQDTTGSCVAVPVTVEFKLDLSESKDPSSGWLPAATLSEMVRDRLAVLLGDPPSWFRPIRPKGTVIAVFVVAEDPPGDNLEMLDILAGWTGSWLSAVESQWMATRLGEELADINRRLADSQAAITRVRSLAMVGEMAAGAAHEINNPLAVISGRAQLLQRIANEEEARHAAEIIADQAHRASTIVSELMDFAKPAPPQPSTWPIGPLLGELRRYWMVHASLSDPQFQLVLSDDLPAVHADAEQTRKLFDELIRNAVEAMADTSNRRLMVNCSYNVADDRVVVRIEDNGAGMTADVLERATDPFFSFRPAGRGRGLGLSRAVRFAEINGGQLRLASRPGYGTVAVVSLPAASGG